MSRPAIGHYAGGGVAQEMPPVQDMDASQTATSAAPPPGPAVGATPQQANPVGASAGAPVGPGGDSNEMGFDAKDALDSWRKADHDGKPVSADNVNPVRYGLAAMQEAYTKGKGATALDGGHASMAAGLQTHDGAMTPNQYAELGKAVDPKRELSDSAAYMARLDATVKHALATGNEKAAKAMAWSLVQYGKMNSEKFGNFALERLKSGDLAGAGKMLEKAYDWSPDGNRLEAFQGQDGLLHAKTVDLEGKETDLGAFNGAQVMKVTLGVASGSEFLKHMQQIAGMKEEKPVKADKGMATPSLSNRTKGVENVESAASGFKLEPESAKGIKSVASQIHDRNDVDPSAALRHTIELTTARTGEPKYKISKPGADGYSSVKMADGAEFKVSKNTLTEIDVLRGKSQANLEKLNAKEAGDKEAADKATALRGKEKEQREALRGGPRKSPAKLAREEADQRYPTP